MKLVVPESAVKHRLDVFVTEEIGSVSRAFIGKLCDDGKILVNGSSVKNGYKLKVRDIIAIDYDFERLQQIPTIELPILYEDEDCIVLNKPEGVLTHSKGAFNPEGTVATFIAPRITGMDGDRAGIVHRLDRLTSGVLIAAKNRAALAWLQKQFSVRKVKKTYFAVVSGTLEQKEAIIDMPIERNPKNPKTFRVGSMGKPAVTKYKVAAEDHNKTLVQLTPETGRTHQLRVHLAQLGHPIVGDPFYGEVAADRMYLHAESLEITLPSRQRKTFVAPLPDSFRAILNS